MFCKWCGNRIVNNGMPCPTCGKDQGPLENGNYFQDLKTAKSIPPAAQTAVEPCSTFFADMQPKAPCASSLSPDKDTHRQPKAPVFPPAKQKPQQHGFPAIALFLALILLLSSIFLTVISSRKLASNLEQTSRCLDQINAIHTELVNDGALKPSDFLSAYIGMRKASPDALSLSPYPVDSQPDRVLLLASGSLVSGQNGQFVWQKRDSIGSQWETLSDASPYLLIPADDACAYRLLYIVADDASEEVSCYAEYADHLKNVTGVSHYTANSR